MRWLNCLTCWDVAHLQELEQPQQVSAPAMGDGGACRTGNQAAPTPSHLAVSKAGVHRHQSCHQHCTYGSGCSKAMTPPQGDMAVMPPPSNKHQRPAAVAALLHANAPMLPPHSNISQQHPQIIYCSSMKTVCRQDKCWHAHILDSYFNQGCMPRCTSQCDTHQ